MLNIQQFTLTKQASDRIKRWLGAEGASDFMQWLVTRDAVLTAEAGVLMTRSSENASNADEARVKANEAAEYRRMIERMNEARDPDFQFERCEITPAMN